MVGMLCKVLITMCALRSRAENSCPANNGDTAAGNHVDAKCVHEESTLIQVTVMSQIGQSSTPETRRITAILPSPPATSAVAAPAPMLAAAVTQDQRHSGHWAELLMFQAGTAGNQQSSPVTWKMEAPTAFIVAKSFMALGAVVAAVGLCFSDKNLRLASAQSPSRPSSSEPENQGKLANFNDSFRCGSLAY